MFEDFYLKVQLLSENAKVPTRATKGDAGLDLYTPIDIQINPNSDVLIPLDIRLEFPEGYAFIVKEKSGIATKKKLDIGANLVDANYRGSVHVHLFNNSNEIVSFKKGDKIAQGIIVPIWDGQPIQVREISIETERSVGGFGSTGE
jgi:dUTP pyrophosphatase